MSHMLLLLLLRPPPVSGSWRSEEFKDYNFNALGAPVTGGNLHPLMKVGGRAGVGVRPVCVHWGGRCQQGLC